MNEIGRELEARRLLLLDGATGSELARRGIKTRLPLWSAAALLTDEGSAATAAIHADYVAAGADIVTANTFRTTARTLDRSPLPARTTAAVHARALTRHAVALARSARPRFVAGSMAPLEDCYVPALVPSDAELAREHADHARALAEAGVDLLLVETINCAREALAAAKAATATGLPTVVGLVCATDGRLLSGERVADTTRALLAFPLAGLAINCTPTPTLHEPLTELLATVAGRLPCGAWGNIGHTDEIDGWTCTRDCPPAEYAAAVQRWQTLGATLLGGCCGTTPEHLGAVRQLLLPRS